MPSVHQEDLAYIGVAGLAVWAAGKAATQPMTVYLTANCVLTGSIKGIVEAYSSGLPKDTVDKAILVASALLVAILVGVQIATKGLPFKLPKLKSVTKKAASASTPLSTRATRSKSPAKKSPGKRS